MKIPILTPSCTIQLSDPLEAGLAISLMYNGAAVVTIPRDIPVRIRPLYNNGTLVATAIKIHPTNLGKAECKIDLLRPKLTIQEESVDPIQAPRSKRLPNQEASLSFNCNSWLSFEIILLVKLLITSVVGISVSVAKMLSSIEGVVMSTSVSFEPSKLVMLSVKFKAEVSIKMPMSAFEFKDVRLTSIFINKYGNAGDV